jgi:hypothetical protein
VYANQPLHIPQKIRKSRKGFENIMKTLENQKEQIRVAEFDKLSKLFESVEESKRLLTEQLISDAAFLASENFELRHSLKETGMININPNNPKMQKPIEAARQYRQNISAYALIIKTLNFVLSRDQQEVDDEFDNFVKEHQGVKNEKEII